MNFESLRIRDSKISLSHLDSEVLIRYVITLD
uniref:Uncharacterized protein n=1 Tax=Salmonella phage vB_SEnST11_KE23 TaxID=3161174 RepID=A0AAU8GFV6_9CAUD